MPRGCKLKPKHIGSTLETLRCRGLKFAAGSVTVPLLEIKIPSSFCFVILFSLKVEDTPGFKAIKRKTQVDAAFSGSL